MVKARAGDQGAMDAIAEAYYKGEGVPLSFEEAYKWSLKAAKSGNLLSERRLGVMFFKGEGVERDEDKAFSWFLRGAKDGDFVCQRLVAEAYEKGWGTASSSTEMVKWLRRAASQGDLISAKTLGLNLLNGVGIQRDVQQGLAFLLLACQQSAEARMVTAEQYRDGENVKQDNAEAEKWYLLAQDSCVDSSPELSQKVRLQQQAMERKMEPGEIAEGKSRAEAFRKWLDTGDIQNDDLSLLYESNTMLAGPVVRDHILIPVKVNERDEPMNFLLDTGAAYSLINSVDAKALGLTGTEVQPARGVGDKAALLTVAEHVRLKAPGLTVLGAHIGILPKFPVDHVLGLPCQGILGYDILKHVVVKIDFEHGYVQFVDPAAFKPIEGATEIPMDLVKNAPCIDGTLVMGGREFTERFIFDVGANSGLELSSHFREKNPDFQMKTLAEGTAFGLGGLTHSEMGLVDELRFGAISMKNAEVGEMERSALPCGLVGNEVWGRFDVVLDGPGKRIFLKPNANFNRPSMLQSVVTGLGMEVKPTESDEEPGFRVAYVNPAGRAAKSGVQVGDLITAVNDTSTENMSLRDVEQLLVGKVDHLKVDRDGTATDISLK